MINIRYHIVSITAVFLALGIGVALGSTFLDGATVDVLNKNISSAEGRIKEANAKIDGLEDQRDAAAARDAGLILLGTDRLLGDQLTDQPVLVVAEPGLGDGELAGLLSVLARSGADLRGTLQLQDRLAFTGEPDAELIADLGLDDDTTAAQLRAVVTEQLTDALAAAGAVTSPGDDTTSTTTTTTTTTTSTDQPTTTTTAATTTTTAAKGGETAGPDGSQPDIIGSLIDHGYLEIAPGPGRSDDDPILEKAGYRYVFVGSASPRGSDTAILLSLLSTEADATVPAVVVAPSVPPLADDDERAPTAVADVRDSDELAVRYSTVDDIDTFAGLAATVFSLADLGTAPVGHYGQADGATALLPPAP